MKYRWYRNIFFGHESVVARNQQESTQPDFEAFGAFFLFLTVAVYQEIESDRQRQTLR